MQNTCAKRFIARSIQCECMRIYRYIQHCGPLKLVFRSSVAHPATYDRPLQSSKENFYLIRYPRKNVKNFYYLKEEKFLHTINRVAFHTFHPTDLALYDISDRHQSTHRESWIFRKSSRGMIGSVEVWKHFEREYKSPYHATSVLATSRKYESIEMKCFGRLRISL